MVCGEMQMVLKWLCWSFMLGNMNWLCLGGPTGGPYPSWCHLLSLLVSDQACQQLLELKLAHGPVALGGNTGI